MPYRRAALSGMILAFVLIAATAAVCVAQAPNPGEMVSIPAGSFKMGCDPAHNGGFACGPGETPLHTVTLDAFSIDKYEVTNAQYAACVAAGACTAPASNSSKTHSTYYNNSTYANYPVIYVSWNNASAYCAWVGKRLPTEAEWEKAARGAADTRAFAWGDSSPTCSRANANGCIGDTSAVGGYAAGASAYGVMDMAGNVWEWVNDWYSSNYYSSPAATNNPAGPATGTEKSNRGGSWFSVPAGIRVANRGHVAESTRLNDVGFRCAKTTASPQIYKITGRVIDGTGIGIGGVTLSAGAGYSTTTNSTGNFTLSSLGAGTYALRPTKAGLTFQPGSRSVIVTSADKAGQNFSGSSRAMWVWDRGEAIIRDYPPGTRSAFFSFCRAPKGQSQHSIGTIYLHTPIAFLTNAADQGKLTDILKAAQGGENKLAVHFLLPRGTDKDKPDDWIADSQHLAQALQVMTDVVEFNEAAEYHPTMQFAGIHVDIEPAEIAGWIGMTTAQEMDLWNNYFALLRGARERIDAFNFSHEPDMVLGADMLIDPWYRNEIPGWNSDYYYQEALKYVDYITSMDYAEQSNDTVARVRRGVEYAARSGKLMAVGVETDNIHNPSRNLYEWMTFYEEGWRFMEAEIAKTCSAFATNIGFGGTAIHYYLRYDALSECGSRPSSHWTILEDTVSMLPQEVHKSSVYVRPGQYSAHFGAGWSGSTVDMKLVEPNGRVITGSVSPADPKISHYSGETFTGFYVDDPASGDWQVELIGVDLPAGGEDVDLAVSTEGPLAFYLPVALR